MKTPDLIDILKEPTEKKSIFTEPDPDDFLQPEKTEENGSFDFFTADSTSDDEKPSPDKKEEKTFLSDDEYRDNASMVVGTIDALQTLTLPFLYQRAMFTRDERLRLKQIKQMQQSDEELILTEEDQILLDKYDTFLQLKDSVPFTDMESKMLIDPLAKIFKKYNMSLGPEIMLFTALATVSVPRFLPLFTPLERM